MTARVQSCATRALNQEIDEGNALGAIARREPERPSLPLWEGTGSRVAERWLADELREAGREDRAREANLLRERGHGPPRLGAMVLRVCADAHPSCLRLGRVADPSAAKRSMDGVEGQELECAENEGDSFAVARRMLSQESRDLPGSPASPRRFHGEHSPRGRSRG